MKNHLWVITAVVGTADPREVNPRVMVQPPWKHEAVYLGRRHMTDPGTGRPAADRPQKLCPPRVGADVVGSLRGPLNRIMPIGGPSDPGDVAGLQTIVRHSPRHGLSPGEEAAMEFRRKRLGVPHDSRISAADSFGPKSSHSLESRPCHLRQSPVSGGNCMRPHSRWVCQNCGKSSPGGATSRSSDTPGVVTTSCPGWRRPGWPPSPPRGPGRCRLR